MIKKKKKHITRKKVIREESQSSLDDLAQLDNSLNTSLDFLNNPQEDVYTQQDGDDL